MTTPLETLTLDTGQQLWTITAVCKHIGVGRNTFTAYVNRGQAPSPAYRIGRSSLWDAEEVKTWHARRPGSPIPNHPGST